MGLFREKAMQSSSTLSDVGRGIAGIRISVWLSVMGLGLCAAVFMIWLFFGTIYETVSVTGLVWPLESGGTVYAETTGIVTGQVIYSGAEVKAGDILAILYDDEALMQLDLAKTENSSAFAELQKKYIRKTVVRSHVDGIVSHIVDKDTRVAEGEVVAEVIPFDKDGNNKRITTFIPADRLDQIENNMEVQIVPEFASRDRDGYVYGYISSVGKYPITGEYVKQYYDSIFSLGIDMQEKYICVEITMVSDANAKSGLKWSNTKSEEIDIGLGTLCHCDVVTNKLQPYQYLVR